MIFALQMAAFYFLERQQNQYKGVILIVIYISELRPDLLDDVFSKHFLMYNKVKSNEFKKLIISSGANFSYASHFVVDLSSVNDSPDEIMDAIAAIKTMYKSKRVIVIADKEPKNSTLLSRLYDKGIYDIVTDLNGDDVAKCILTGKTKEEAATYSLTQPIIPVTKEVPSTPQAQEKSKPDARPPAMVPNESAKDKITANRSFRKHKPFITVAVCSTEPHMGATHQALLITKFLSDIGFKACYLEANMRRKIFCLASAYAVNANEKKKLLQFDGVDMYFDFRLPDIVSVGYDFFVFDFGCFDETEMTSFLTKDIKIVVGGAKAWEIPAYKRVFDGIGTRASPAMDINFILNFAPKKEMADIKELMGEYRKNTFFAEYTPYPFEPEVNLSIYKLIFADYIHVEKAEAPTGSRKKKFFMK